MPTSEELFGEIEALRRKLEQAAADAEARNDSEALKKIDAALLDVDDARVDLAMSEFAKVAAALVPLRAKVDAATKLAKSWPFGSADAPSDHERPFRELLQENDFDDAGPTAPPPSPAPVPPDKLPVVSAGWADNYMELWRTMAVRPEWQDTADAIAKKIIANQSRYAAAVSGLSVPWWFISIVHAMECSLKFNEHLHNGDPLTARTVRVPKDRPPAGAPPFTWEESARDSIVFEKLDKVVDWSLASALFHWHLYNGINNKYKTLHIPTPYLWSGSQHYRKGKYVADHQFDTEAVSKQIGAAVILKALIDLGAVTIDQQFGITGNPAVVNKHLSSLTIDTSGNAFNHVAAELDYPGLLKVGSGKNAADKRGVKRVQEWLNIHGFATPIDSDFGNSTTDQLSAFQAKSGRPVTGELDMESWSMLTAPMRRALAKAGQSPVSSLEDAVIRVAQQHISERPSEVGSNNAGPWVRLYMQGIDGETQKWCAGFVCFVVNQAARDIQTPQPFKRQVSVDELVNDAKESQRFISESALPDLVRRKSKLRPGCIFVVRSSPVDWTHTGIVLSIKDQTFDTLEGNTGGDGGNDGPNARQGNRSYSNKDFLNLV